MATVNISVAQAANVLNAGSKLDLEIAKTNAVNADLEGFRAFAKIATSGREIET